MERDVPTTGAVPADRTGDQVAKPKPLVASEIKSGTNSLRATRSVLVLALLGAILSVYSLYFPEWLKIGIESRIGRTTWAKGHAAIGLNQVCYQIRGDQGCDSDELLPLVFKVARCLLLVTCLINTIQIISIAGSSAFYRNLPLKLCNLAPTSFMFGLTTVILFLVGVLQLLLSDQRSGDHLLRNVYFVDLVSVVPTVSFSMTLTNVMISLALFRILRQMVAEFHASLNREIDHYNECIDALNGEEESSIVSAMSGAASSISTSFTSTVGTEDEDEEASVAEASPDPQPKSTALETRTKFYEKLNERNAGVSSTIRAGVRTSGRRTEAEIEGTASKTERVPFKVEVEHSAVPNPGNPVMHRFEPMFTPELARSKPVLARFLQSCTDLKESGATPGPVRPPTRSTSLLLRVNPALPGLLSKMAVDTNSVNYNSETASVVAAQPAKIPDDSNPFDGLS